MPGSQGGRQNHNSRQPCELCGQERATLLEVHFSPVWYSITEHQPIEKDCVFSEDKIKRVKILAGRHKSKQVRDDFVEVFPGQPELQPQNMVCSTCRTGTGGTDDPAELNFVFGVAQFDTSFSRRVVLRLAQGHYFSKTGHNNWWIAGEDCQKQEDGKGLICEAQGGAGQIAIWPSDYDSFGVSPFP